MLQETLTPAQSRALQSGEGLAQHNRAATQHLNPKCVSAVD